MKNATAVAAVLESSIDTKALRAQIEDENTRLTQQIVLADSCRQKLARNERTLAMLDTLDGVEALTPVVEEVVTAKLGPRDAVLKAVGTNGGKFVGEIIDRVLAMPLRSKSKNKKALVAATLAHLVRSKQVKKKSTKDGLVYTRAA